MPDTGTEIKIEGLNELIKKLDDLKQLSKVHAGFKAGALYLKGKLAQYPPPTIANQPGNPSGRWYVRGFGWKFASGRTDPVSEDLAGKWTIKYDQNKFEAMVGNNASYAVFVQGPKEGPKGSRQAKHMARIGWKSITTVAEQETKRVEEYVFEAVKRAIGV